MFPGCWFFALIISRRVVFMGVVIVNTKKWRQTVCGCVFWRDSGVWGETMSCQCSFHLHGKSKKKNSSSTEKDLRNIWGDLGYFVEALGNKSVNWPLPALAPPSQCVVAACLRHGPHLPETDCHFLAFFFFVVFSPCSGLGRRLYPTEQRRGEESSRAHLQKGCRWARETRSVLWVCSCLALHTSAKLGSSIRSVVWACWMKWIEREWERVRGTEVFWCFLSGFLLHLSLSFFLHLLPSSPFPRLKQGRESELNHPGVHRSLCRSPRCCHASLEQRLDPVKKQGRDREKS